MDLPLGAVLFLAVDSLISAVIVLVVVVVVLILVESSSVGDLAFSLSSASWRGLSQPFRLLRFLMLLGVLAPLPPPQPLPPTMRPAKAAGLPIPKLLDPVGKLAKRSRIRRSSCSRSPWSVRLWWRPATVTNSWSWMSSAVSPVEDVVTVENHDGLVGGRNSTEHDSSSSW